MGAAGTSGCTRRLRSLFGRDGAQQLGLTIKTLPADADPWAVRTARHLATNLQSVGIGARVVPVSRVALLRDVLVNNAFDLYIARLPAFDDPDYLRGLLHSRFGVEPGWQNPFGYADLSLDTLLERQRRQAGDARERTLTSIQETVARNQPFSVVAFPDEIHAVRTDRLQQWSAHKIHTPLGYLSMTSAAKPSRRSSRTPTTFTGTSSAQPTTDTADNGTRAPTRTSGKESDIPPDVARMTVADSSELENLNPIAVEYRDTGTIIGLLYDPLGRWIDGAIQPWLAESWRWRGTATATHEASSSPTADGATLDIHLRESLTWHDGTSLTADDVAFTYRFLQDTSLGRFESPVPAPRFRSRSSLVESAEAVTDTTVRVVFRPASRPVALRAMTVPVLPAHVWHNRTGRASIAGVDPGRAVTDALVRTDRNPVGSGPLQFESATRRESVTLARNDDHFLERSDLDENLRPYRGGFTLDTLQFVFAPSDSAAVSLVREGAADGTATGVTPGTVPEIGRDSGLSLHTEPSRSCYHVGFNLRRTPYGNPRFRRAVARLVDEAHLVETVFDGYATPATSPLARHDTLAPALEWGREAPVLPFPGERGQLDAEQARDVFRRAGYRYASDGRLIVS